MEGVAPSLKYIYIYVKMIRLSRFLAPSTVRSAGDELGQGAVFQFNAVGVKKKKMRLLPCSKSIISIIYS